MPNASPDATIRIFEALGELKKLQGKTILDVGSANGESTRYLQGFGLNAYALDPVKFSDANSLGDHFIHSRMECLPSQYHQTFDAVIEGNCLSHSGSDTWKNFIAMEAAALKPDGKLLSLWEVNVAAGVLRTTPKEIAATYRHYFKDVSIRSVQKTPAGFTTDEIADIELEQARIPSHFLILQASGPCHERCVNIHTTEVAQTSRRE